METCEVLIVGGGPAGSSCAGTLANAGVAYLILKDWDVRGKNQDLRALYTGLNAALGGLDALLRDGAKLWLSDNLTLYEGDAALPAPRIASAMYVGGIAIENPRKSAGSCSLGRSTGAKTST